ncbi:DUF2272 domain-containing protein [Lysobacter sp. N42]|nr:DUF2272 domain-containing protein [Lysobacter sp. N42]
MPTPRCLPTLLMLASLALAARAQASDGCAGAPGGDTASRIAAVACAEHASWYSPFIDEAGRLAHLRVSEAEALRLRDGTPAWRRVAAYWQGSGLGWPPDGLHAQADCFGAAPERNALCRSFLVDTPWSAVFVSWVMARAGVPGFAHSARHVDYVRQAWRGVGPYRYADPDATPPAVGDLLCYSRMPAPFGVAGFRAWLARGHDGPLAMHCDIVVSTANARARLVGGNVLQGVTMRLLPLNAAGRFWNLPRRTGADPECSPALPSACNLHRHDWVALLKLDAAANLPAPPATPPGPCCEICHLPMPPGMRRCAAPAPPPATPPAP